MYFVDSDNFALINDDTVIFIIIIFNIIISNYYLMSLFYHSNSYCCSLMMRGQRDVQLDGHRFLVVASEPVQLPLTKQTQVRKRVKLVTQMGLSLTMQIVLKRGWWLRKLLARDPSH